MEEPSSTRSSLSWLALVPAVVAGVLALVYALGAIAVYGQIKGAGLSGVQVMPLVPIEQILGRGIGSIASLFSRLVVSLGLSGIMAASYWSERNERAATHPKDWSRTLRFGPPALILFIGIVGPWKEAVVLGIGLITMLGTWALGGMLGLRGWRAVVIVSCGSVVSIIPMSIASSLLEPSPLPVVRIEAPSHPTVKGGLIAETRNNWYIALPDHNVRAMPNGGVVRATIEYPDRKREPSLVQRIF